MRKITLLCLIVFGTVNLFAEHHEVSRNQFDQWMVYISNWGRWGPEDELGTLNLITPQKRKESASLVKEGVSISMALELNTVSDELNTNPFVHELQTATFGGHDVAGDSLSLIHI